MGWLVGLALVAPAKLAYAQGMGGVVPPPAAPSAPAPPPVVLTPPSLKKDDGAQYPEAALKQGIRDTVTVVLVVEIDPQGLVKSASPENPQGGPFEEAAVEAARKLEFEPARRNETPIAAKIKHRYTFAPPASKITGRIARQGEGVAVAGATVTLARVPAVEGDTPRAVTTAEDGRFAFEDVPFGRYHLEVDAPGFEKDTLDEEVSPGEVAALTFRLTARPTVAGPTTPGGATSAEEVEEVRVRGQRPPREVTRRTLEQRELTRIPGTNGDALRAVQNLPGVARPPGLAGLLIVRGSAPQATNIFVDGTLIPIVYHFGGLSSVIPTEMLERIDFFPGNFSTYYGRVTGGVIDIAVRDPKKDGRFHGMAQMDLIDTRLMVEGPIGQSGWRFAVAGRRSWVDVWLKPVLEATGAGVTTAPVYYDYQAVLQRDFSKDSNLRLMFFGSDDRLELLIKQAAASDPSIGGGLGFHTGFWRLQGRYRQRFSPDTELRLMTAVGSDVAEFNLGDNKFTLASYPVTTRVEVAQKLARPVTMNVGMDLLWAPYDVFVRFPRPGRPGEPPPGPGLSRPPLETKDSDALYRPAMYTELEVTPVTGTRIVPGVRADYAKDNKSWNVGPRITARQDLVRGFPRTTLKGGAGVFYQPPQPQETNVVFGIPGSKSAKAIHYGVGVEQEITQHLEVSLEGFYKDLSNFFTNGVGAVAEGKAYGLETLIRYKPDARFFGWVAYTLSRSVLKDTPTEPERLAQFDQSHILTILGSYKLGRGWEIGGRFRLVSGSLTTPRAYGFFDENAGAQLPLTAFPPFGQRLPAFHQLDIRVDKVWNFRQWTLSAYLDVLNVYNAGNVEGVSYNYNYTRSSYATGLPILPSIGLRAEF